MTLALPLADNPVADIASLTLMQPFLVLAPHPDDETLGCGGLIAHGCRLGLKPAVVILTDGAASHLAPGWAKARLADQRATEVHDIAKTLGLPAARLFLLNAPDGALTCDDDTLATLRGVLQKTGARALFVTDPADSHPDHRVAFRLAVRLVAEGSADALATYPVTQRLEGVPCHRFERLTVQPEDQIRKRHAIARHQNQLGTVLPPDSGFVLSPANLAAFRDPRELFRPVHGLPVCPPPEDPSHFDALFSTNHDPWDYETSPYEQARHATTIAALDHKRAARAWEAGTASGVLAEKLLPFCDDLVVSDASPVALAHARARLQDRADIRWLQLPAEAPEGPFDLILLSDMLYYLGLTGVIQTAALCRQRLAPGGRILVVNGLGDTNTTLTGLEAAEAFAACTLPYMSLARQDTHLGFQLDLYEDAR